MSIKDKLPIFLAILLYILIYLLRMQQGGWEVEFDLLKTQREGLDKRISKLLPSPQAELLSGILLGQSKNLPPRLKLALRDTSTLHIAVASGQNLTLVSGFFLTLAGLIKRKNALILSLIASLIYTVLTGMQVPILRALIMFSLASTAQFFGRQRSGFWVLTLTSGSMLLINPAWISSLSFQLSFLATFGVVVVSPIFLKYMQFPIIGSDLAVTLAAILMVEPVIAQNFHQISLVSLISNVLILWTIPFIMVIGAIMLILGPLAGLLAIGANILLTYLIYIIQFFSSLPFAWVYIGEQSVLVWVGYYILVGGILLWLSQISNIKTQN